MPTPSPPEGYNPEFATSLSALARSLAVFPDLKGMAGMVLIPFGPGLEEGDAIDSAVLSKGFDQPELSGTALVALLLLVAQQIADQVGMGLKILDAEPPAQRTPRRPAGRRPRRHG